MRMCIKPQFDKEMDYVRIQQTRTLLAVCIIVSFFYVFMCVCRIVIKITYLLMWKCGMCVFVVALTKRYKTLHNKVTDKSKQSAPVPVMSTIAGLESWLSEAEQIFTSCRSTTPDNTAQLELAVRQHRVCVCCTCFTGWYLTTQARVRVVDDGLWFNVHLKAG